MHVTANRLLDALRAEGHRITDARRAICAVIAGAHREHLDAARILELTESQHGRRVDQSTVYRTLEALEAAGLVVHTHLGHHAAVYHLADETSHSHLVCDRCGTTIPVDAADLMSWAQAIRRRTGFVVEPGHFALTGLCAGCVADERTGEAVNR